MQWSQPNISSDQPFKFGFQISTRQKIAQISIVLLIIVVIILAIVLIQKVKRERFQIKSSRDMCMTQIQNWYDKLINNPLKEKKITEEQVRQAWPQIELILTWLVGPCVSGFWSNQTVGTIEKVTKLSDLPNFSKSLVDWWTKYLKSLKYDEKQIKQVRDNYEKSWNTGGLK